MLLSAFQFQYFAGGFLIAFGLVYVFIGLRNTLRNLVPAQPWNICCILTGIGALSFGSFLALGYAVDIFVYALPLPALGWVLVVVGVMSSIGEATIVGRQQRQPPHGA
jgi:hypothetical protein